MPLTVAYLQLHALGWEVYTKVLGALKPLASVGLRWLVLSARSTDRVVHQEPSWCEVYGDVLAYFSEHLKGRALPMLFVAQDALMRQPPYWVVAIVPTTIEDLKFLLSEQKGGVRVWKRMSSRCEGRKGAKNTTNSSSTNACKPEEYYLHNSSCTHHLKLRLEVVEVGASDMRQSNHEALCC
jgi:hypothetical protein